jgi:hypothetical protein
MGGEFIFKVDLSTGDVEMEAVGFAGDSCKELDEFAGKVGIITERDRKAIYWNRSAVEGERHIDLDQGGTCDG